MDINGTYALDIYETVDIFYGAHDRLGMKTNRKAMLKYLQQKRI